MSGPERSPSASRDLSLLEALRRRGWTIKMAAGSRELLPPKVAARYPSLPAAVSTFLGSVERCCSPDETAWFLTAGDYARENTDGLRWNEYEFMALGHAEGDADWQAKVVAFWDRHFPFMLAVHSDYDYLAVRLEDGAVVHGYAPEWEEPSTIAQSFVEFIVDFEREASKPDASYPLSVFLGAV